MTRRSWPQWSLALLLAAVSLGMALLALRGPDEGATGDRADLSGASAARDGSLSPAPADAGDAPAYAPPPAADYDVIVARNLFDVSRQPPPDSDSAPDAESVESKDFALEGVIRTPDRQVAILLDKRGSKTVRVTLGEDYGGWTLDSVENGHVILSRASETLRLDLPSLIGKDSAGGLTANGVPPARPLTVQPRRGDTEGNPVRAQRRPLASQTVQPDS